MQHIRAHVLVCGGTGCKANGSKEIQLTFARELQKFGLQDEVMLKQAAMASASTDRWLSFIRKVPSIAV